MDQRTCRHGDAYYYHVTLKDNLDSILGAGLVPRIGERSAAYGEVIPRVYLFTSQINCEAALSSWLGDALEDVEEDGLVILEIDPAGLQGSSDVPYECAYEDVIPPGAIVRVLDERLNAIPGPRSVQTCYVRIATPALAAMLCSASLLVLGGPSVIHKLWR